MDKRILVTGATGFIGHILCRELFERGYGLTVLSRQKPDSVRSICGRVEVTDDLEKLRAHPGEKYTRETSLCAPSEGAVAGVLGVPAPSTFTKRSPEKQREYYVPHSATSHPQVPSSE